MPTTTNDGLRCRRLVVGYNHRPLLPPIDVDIEPGSFWAVVGRNGAGKSTLFKTMLGLIPPVSGSVDRPRGQIAYLPQRMAFDDLYPIEVRDMVAAGTMHGWSVVGRTDWGRVAEAMEAVGIQDLGRRSFRSLSGGQKQRALFARMLASGAKVALLDEPTVGMDAVAERDVMRLLTRLRHEYGLTLVLVTHYLQVARNHAEQILFLDPDREVVLTGTPLQVFASPAFLERYGAAADEVSHG